MNMPFQTRLYPTHTVVPLGPVAEHIKSPLAFSSQVILPTPVISAMFGLILFEQGGRLNSLAS